MAHHYFSAQEHKRKTGRCPKGFTADANGRCQRAGNRRRHYGRVPGRGKGHRSGGLIARIRELAEAQTARQGATMRVSDRLREAEDLFNEPEAKAIAQKFKDAVLAASNLCKSVVKALTAYSEQVAAPNWNHLGEMRNVTQNLNAALTLLQDRTGFSGAVDSNAPGTGVGGGKLVSL